MTTTVVATWAGYGATLAVPAEAEAGDLLIAHVVNWPSAHHTNSGFAAIPAGWTERANRVHRVQKGTDGYVEWGLACYTRTATGSETSLTVTPQTEIAGTVLGAVVVVRSTAPPIAGIVGGWSLGGIDNRLRANPPAFYGSGGGLIIWAFAGTATAITGYADFVGTRTHLATLTQHSTYPFSGLSGPPGYYERFRDLIFTVESETMNPASGVDRNVITNFPYGLVAPISDDDVPCSVTAVYNVEPLIVAAGGWNVWVVD